MSSDNEWRENYPVPYEIEFFDYEDYDYKVEPDNDYYLGGFDPELNSLIVTESHIEERTVLHEMIHLHEDVFKSCIPVMRDLYFLELYHDLKKKIDDLDDLIMLTSHVILSKRITSLGGNHDILFMLKSFDLDLKLNYPLGTIYGYGKQEVISEYRRNIKTS